MTRWLPSRAWAALFAGALACAAPGALAPPANLLIVTLDTTRADRLSPYGFQSAAMPALEQLAGDGIVFLQTFTVAPLTLPAHSSLLTGLYPPHHGVRENGSPPLGPAPPTLAQMLRGQGVRTAAFVAADVLRADRGLARGFEVYHDTTSGRADAPTVRRPANEVVDDALRWLNAQNGSRFFAWVHLYDAHAPCQPPEPYLAQFATDPYEGSVAFMDAQVHRLIRWLEMRRELGRTLIVVAGDHGESLGDHGEREHGIFVYDSVLHVPLIMRVPGRPPRRFTPVTSLVDVMPTILGLMRLRPVATDGVDLTRAMRGATELPDRAVYAESLYPRDFGLSPLRAVRYGRMKFIDAPRPELYDLGRDPFEEHNLYHARSAAVGAMKARLETFDGLEMSSGALSGGTTPDPDVRRRLEALGYVAGEDARLPATAARDPKDYIEAYNAMRRAGAFRRGRSE